MKQTSVILKRQVPIRFDEAPRSWLGGLPMMPRLIKWPRDGEGAPLHFIAQICCADLPKTLWNGLGPRKGWLLCFSETLKLDDFAESPTVQVLHIKRLGPERQPPKDAPTVRHAMSDYIDYSSPNVRPGVAKFWRKWPVDIVVHEYEVPGDEQDECGPPLVPAEDLYDGPVATDGINGNLCALDRPLTWRGALYVVEGALRDLEPEEFKQNYIGNQGGLLERPVVDRDAFDKLVEQRVAQRPELEGMIFHLRASAIEEIKLEVRAELSSGWLSEAHPLLDAKIAKTTKERNECRSEAAEVERHELQPSGSTLASKLEYLEAKITSMEEDRRYLDDLTARYSGPEGEAKLTAEIQEMGKGHLAWGAQKRRQLETIYERSLSKELDAPISDSDWFDIKQAITGDSYASWRGALIAGDNRILKKVAARISIDKYLRMAIREDVLDLYAHDSESRATLPQEQIEELEQRLRFIEDGVLHRMGGQPDKI